MKFRQFAFFSKRINSRTFIWKSCVITFIPNEFCKKRGEIHLAFAMYLIFLCRLILIKNRKKLCIYAGFVDFCPIIPYSSTLLTIPVAVPDICLRRTALLGICRPRPLAQVASSATITRSHRSPVAFIYLSPLQTRRGGCPHPPVKISPCWAGRCRHRPLHS